MNAAYPGESPRRIAAESLTIVPVDTTGRLTLTDVDTRVGACVAGAGIAQVLALGVEHLIANGVLSELFPEWPGETFPLYAIRPSWRLPPAAVEAFLDFCRDSCAAVEPTPNTS